MKRVFVLLAEGFEEIETVVPVDLLRRAGAEAVLMSVENTEYVAGSHGITIRSDAYLGDTAFSSDNLPDAVFVPGGMVGAKGIAASEKARELISLCAKEKKLTAAICAAPAVVLAPLGILAGHEYTCFPGMEEELAKYAGDNWQKLTEGAVFCEEMVVCDGNIVTSRAAGTAADIALIMISWLFGETTAQSVGSSTLFL